MSFIGTVTLGGLLMLSATLCDRSQALGRSRLGNPSTSTSSPRIVGGQPASLSQVPFIVNLRQNERFICGGSLVTPHCVLTAAHCIYQATPSEISVQLASDRLQTAPLTRRCDRSFVPADYSRDTLDMDVGIVHFPQGIPINDSAAAVRTARISPTPPEDRQLVRIAGWGQTSEFSGRPSNQLRSTQVRVVPHADCSQAYKGKAVLTDTMFCARATGPFGQVRDSCFGDSGGPAVCSGNQLCGIVSWGFGCARPQYPGVYTNVASRRVQEYLRHVIADNCI